MKKTFSSYVLPLLLSCFVAPCQAQGVSVGTTGTNVNSSFGGINGQPQFGFGTRLGGSRIRFGFFGEQGSSLSLNSETPTLTLWNGAPGSFQSGFLQPFVTGITPVVGARPTISPVRAAIQRYGIDALRDPNSAGQSGKTSAQHGARVNRQKNDSSNSQTYARSRSFSSANRPDISVAEIKKANPVRFKAKRSSVRRRPILILEEIPRPAKK